MLKLKRDPLHLWRRVGLWVLAAPLLVLAQVAAAQQSAPLNLLKPLDRAQVTVERLRFLADKAGFGLGKDEQEMLRLGMSQGIEAAVAEFMRHKPELCNTAGDTKIFGIGETACFDDFVKEQLAGVDGTDNSRNRRRSLEALTGFRFVHSTNAFEQRMFVHLLGLFTTSLRPETLQTKAAEMSSYVELLRAAVESETDLIALAKDVTKHPMMLNFLSGNGSKGPDANENYGREFMGLMSIGVEDLDGNLNYTDADVVQSSRAYTGFVVNGRTAAFVPANFIAGPKVLFPGKRHECTAVSADDAVECAFQHPNAPIHCATELLDSFVTSNPSRDLVLELARVCKANDFQLRPVMKILLSSQAFFDQANADALPKQCYEIYTGMVRTMDLPITAANFSAGLTGCNEGNVLAAPGALFFPIDGPTSPLTKIDNADFVVARLRAVAGSYDADPALSADKIEKALFTDKGLRIDAPGTDVFNSCMTDLGLASTLSPEQKGRFMQLFNPAQYDAGTRDQKLAAMLGCYRRFVLSTEFTTH